jgi:hypothetical protein
MAAANSAANGYHLTLALGTGILFFPGPGLQRRLLIYQTILL